MSYFGGHKKSNVCNRFSRSNRQSNIQKRKKSHRFERLASKTFDGSNRTDHLLRNVVRFSDRSLTLFRQSLKNFLIDLRGIRMERKRGILFCFLRNTVSPSCDSLTYIFKFFSNSHHNTLRRLSKQEK